MHTRLRLTMDALALLAAGACSDRSSTGPAAAGPALRYRLNGPLIPSTMTMVTAWDVPQNPLTDQPPLPPRRHSPTPTSREVLALAAYLTWISRGYEVGKNQPWRGQNAIPQPSLVPVGTLDPARGEAIYRERCTSCHGPEGQGVFVGDRKPGPLSGPDSWNDGAGAARTYTLAGIIRYSMPYSIRAT